MAEEELIRFALVLREADRVRARIARDGAVSEDAVDSGLRQPPAEIELSFGPAMAAA